MSAIVSFSLVICIGVLDKIQRIHDVAMKFLHVVVVSGAMFFVGMFFMGSFMVFNNEFKIKGFPKPLVQTAENSQMLLRSYNIVNSYGLFRMMTGIDGRDELIVYGSDDGKEWLPYEFLHKPTRTSKMPTQVAPHQPRLDWQLWFSALHSTPGVRDAYLQLFLYKLLIGSPSVLSLLGKSHSNIIDHNPFPHSPPSYVSSVI